jgi:nucleoside-diphosphate kinase
MAYLSEREAGEFYAVHKERPFFKDLVSFMTSGPVMIQCLEGEGAIAKNRDLMGATDPKKADKGTIRADFAESIDANAVHGSDAPETAAVEIAFFFPGMNVYSAVRNDLCTGGMVGPFAFLPPALGMDEHIRGPGQSARFRCGRSRRVVCRAGREAVSRPQVMRWMHHEGCDDFER